MRTAEVDMSEIAPISQQTSETQVQEEQQIQSQSLDQEPQGGDAIDPKAKFSSMNELKTSYPELHKSIVMGIANSIINDMKKHERRFKEIMKESQR